MDESVSIIIQKQAETIEELAALNKELTALLSQYMACDEYEKRLQDLTEA